MSLTKLLIEDFSEKKFNRLVEFFRDNFFYMVYERDNQLGYSDYYLGGGKYGMVLHSEEYPDSIVRLSRQTGEDYKKAVGRHFENVVHVKFHREIGSLFITVMEKLDPLPEDLEDDVYELKWNVEDIYGEGYLQDYKFYNIIEEDPTILKKGIKRVEKFKTDADEIRKYMSDIINGMNELERIGIEHRDMHTGNIMYDENKDSYKIIDLD